MRRYLLSIVLPLSHTFAFLECNILISLHQWKHKNCISNYKSLIIIVNLTKRVASKLLYILSMQHLGLSSRYAESGMRYLG